ncbi:hypothetical protein GcC1_c15502o18 [Golovinomyces cichoracearum]|uniref:Uncharacterized protein n=1 Tax=Golovinomyces cichoracearum TaxID=62708 RepID=A0A420IYW1_9PEZI|nr:hypothetical protein GcC1_c15502o18 [Golovinomyces cichoracearum]
MHCDNFMFFLCFLAASSSWSLNHIWSDTRVSLLSLFPYSDVG